MLDLLSAGSSPRGAASPLSCDCTHDLPLGLRPLLLAVILETLASKLVCSLNLHDGGGGGHIGAKGGSLGAKDPLRYIELVVVLSGHSLGLVILELGMLAFVARDNTVEDDNDGPG